MNSQQLFYINIILGLLFIAYFVWGRPKLRGPTKLNIKANEDFKKSLIPRAYSQTVFNQKNASRALDHGFVSSDGKMTILEPENVIDLKKHKEAKTLNIYFMYNGHEWEAHEVLGLEPGSIMPEVTEAYQKLIVTSDPSTFEFFEAAYHAVLKKWRDRL